MEKLNEEAPACHARDSNSGDVRSFTAKSDALEEAVNVGCGWGRFRPAILAPFAHVWTFIVFYLVFSFTHGVQGSYTISVLTTLERRFKLPSFLAGALVTVSTVGYMVSAVFVSFFFAKKNQPRLFAGCMLLTSLCALLYVIPHVVYGTGNDVIDAEHAQRQTLTFNSTAPLEDGSGTVQLCGVDGSVGDGVGEDAGESEEKNSECSAAMRLAADEDIAFVLPAMALFAASEILQGIAGAPVWTVGLAFIDDHTNPELSAKLIGLMFTVRFVSPIVSFAMGGFFLTIYANLRETDLIAEHPRWIGAWWMGFLICSIINFAICIPTSMIPKNLRPITASSSSSSSTTKAKTTDAWKEEEEKEEREGEEEGERIEIQKTEIKDKLEKVKDGNKGEEDKVQEKNENLEMTVKQQDVKDETKEQERKETGQESSSSRPPPTNSSDWRELPKATLRLIKNPIYMLASIAICIDCFILGFMAFLPKYFEVYFQKTASVANLLGGMVPAVFGGCASYVGGLVSGRIKGIDGGVAGLCRMNSSLSLICLLFLVPAMFLSCPDVPYSGHVVQDRLNMTTNCNVNCGCSSDVFDPVCGSDGQFYFSPCYAGCTQMINLSTSDSSNDLPGHLVRAAECRCVVEAESSDEAESKTDGAESKTDGAESKTDGAESKTDEEESKTDEEAERGVGIVFAGFCDESCASLIPYVLISVAIFFSINMYNVPCTTIILRCIREEDKSFALGLQTLGICLTIFPAPLLYGSVFDTSCILKETKSCTDSEGSCLLYDRHALRLAFHGLTIGLHAVATVLYYVTYFLARRKLALLTAQRTQLVALKALSANRLIIKEENSNETETVCV